MLNETAWGMAEGTKEAFASAAGYVRDYTNEVEISLEDSFEAMKKYWEDAESIFGGGSPFSGNLPGWDEPEDTGPYGMPWPTDPNPYGDQTNPENVQPPSGTGTGISDDPFDYGSTGYPGPFDGPGSYPSGGPVTITINTSAPIEMTEMDLDMLMALARG